MSVRSCVMVINACGETSKRHTVVYFKKSFWSLHRASMSFVTNQIDPGRNNHPKVVTGTLAYIPRTGTIPVYGSIISKTSLLCLHSGTW